MYRTVQAGQYRDFLNVISVPCITNTVGLVILLPPHWHLLVNLFMTSLRNLNMVEASKLLRKIEKLLDDDKYEDALQELRNALHDAYNDGRTTELKRTEIANPH